MAEQLSALAPELPAELVTELRRLEADHMVRPATLAPTHVSRKGRSWWIALEANGRRCALAMRIDLVAAAGDLFRQIHG